MRARPKRLLALAAAFAVAVLAAVPMPAAAAGGGVKIDLRLHGGLGYVSASDVNAGSAGIFDYVLYNAAQSGVAFQGGYDPLHRSYDFGGDIVFMFSPRFGIGVGAGLLRSSRESEITGTIEDVDQYLRGGPSLKAVPIRLGVLLALPVGRKTNLIASAGAAYYSSLEFTYHIRLGDSEGWLDEMIVGRRSSLAGNLGFQGGLGFEFAVSPRLGVFCELIGRYASFKNFDAVTASIEWSDGETDSVAGKLYLVSEQLGDSATIAFQVGDGVPQGVSREPKFDLSGLSLQAGIRFRI
jgi:hypothetical protein